MRAFSIEWLINAHRAGQLLEVFGTGTAATISSICELKYKDYVIEFDVRKWKVAPELKKRLDAIRTGSVVDKYNWMVRV